ncbi:MAG: Flp pilus assembly protein CpaB [Deltaproteobacteria bacterium]|nr:Flp pilus assembly protein CpaB [Deltaproteobacteria bacterium]
MQTSTIQKDAQQARQGALLYSLFALALTALLSWMLSRLLMGTATPAGPVKPVVVAAEEIPAFTELKAAQLKTAEWPVSSIPDGAFADVDSVVGTPKVNLRALLPGEPLVARRLAPADRGGGAAQLVDPHMRAFVVRVNEPLAMSQLLYPGVYVDVIATLPEQFQKEAIAKVVLQRVQVLAVGPSFDVTLEPAKKSDNDERTDRGKIERQRVVTLQLLPEEVESLAFIMRDATLDLALRNQSDTEVVNTFGASRTTVLGSGVAEAEADKAGAAAKVKRKAKAGPAIYRVGNR